MDELLGLLRRLIGRQVELTPTTPIVSAGLVDSFRFTELLTLLEEKYKVTLDAAALGVDNFDTPAQMQAILAAHARGPGA